VLTWLAKCDRKTQKWANLPFFQILPLIYLLLKKLIKKLEKN